MFIEYYIEKSRPRRRSYVKSEYMRPLQGRPTDHAFSINMRPLQGRMNNRAFLSQSLDLHYKMTLKGSNVYRQSLKPRNPDPEGGRM